MQLPVLLINNLDDTAPLSAVDYLALLGWAFGFFYEALADIEKFTFRVDPANKSKYITTGLWSYSRHPNYFGEIVMWVCMAAAISAVGFSTSNALLHLAWLSPTFTTVLLLKVSGVPMVEHAGQKKWGDDPAYVNYMNQTNMLIPGKPAPPLEAPTPEAKPTPKAKELM